MAANDSRDVDAPRRKGSTLQAAAILLALCAAMMAVVGVVHAVASLDGAAVISDGLSTPPTVAVSSERIGAHHPRPADPFEGEAAKAAWPLECSSSASAAIDSMRNYD